MGTFDVFCIICGNSCFHNKADDAIDYDVPIKQVKEIEKNTAWVKYCTLLFANDKVLHNTTFSGDNADFENPRDGELYTCFEFSYDFNMPFVFLHEDCWKFIKNVYDVEIKFSDIPLFNKKKFEPVFVPNVKYGLEEYQDQFMNYDEMYEDKKLFMAMSPLSGNKKNISRIKRILSAFKLNKDMKRKGPSTSASFYSEGDIKLGINKKFWIKKNGRWNELKEPVITYEYKITTNLSTQKKNKLNSTPPSGFYNKMPIFVSDYDYKNKKITFVGTNNTIDGLKKNFK